MMNDSPATYMTTPGGSPAPSSPGPAKKLRRVDCRRPSHFRCRHDGTAEPFRVAPPEAAARGPHRRPGLRRREDGRLARLCSRLRAVSQAIVGHPHFMVAPTIANSHRSPASETTPKFGRLNSRAHSLAAANARTSSGRSTAKPSPRTPGGEEEDVPEIVPVRVPWQHRDQPGQIPASTTYCVDKVVERCRGAAHSHR